MSLAEEFRFGIAARDVAFNQDVKAIVPRADINGVLLALQLGHEAETVLGMVDEASHGTKRLQTELVEKLSIALPPVPLRDILSEPLVALASKQLAAQRETATLEGLRDALLGALFVDQARTNRPTGEESA
jgi:type I restriction enzyme S subunit